MTAAVRDTVSVGPRQKPPVYQHSDGWRSLVAIAPRLRRTQPSRGGRRVTLDRRPTATRDDARSRTAISCSAVILSICLSMGSHSLSAVAVEPVTLHGVVPATFPVGTTAPVAIPLPNDRTWPAVLTVELRVEGAGETTTVAAQPDIGRDTPTQAWFLWTARQEDLGKKIALRLQPADQNSQPAYAVKVADPQVHVATPDGKPILSYWYGQPDPNQPYAVSDFIHPLIGLDGEMITDNAPADHRHHRGVFWSWVRYERNEESIGSWWIPDRLRCEPAGLETGTGPVFAAFQARQFMVHRPQADSSDERILEQHITCRVFPTTPIGRAVDVDLSIRALQNGLRIGGQTAIGKGYGGMTVRYGPGKEPRIEVDGEFHPKDLIRHRANWASWTGLFPQADGQPGQKRSGAALLVHPSHPDVPPEWLTRYYGVLCVCYPGLDMLDVGKDTPLRLRYRVWIHRGAAREGGVDAQYRAYAADWQWKPGKKVSG